MLRPFVYFAFTLLLIGSLLLVVFNHSEALTLPEDINKDGIVNVQDLVLVANAFGQPANPNADVNGDGIVNVLDLGPRQQPFRRDGGDCFHHLLN